jgi:glycosyltransferase involved in cell wall biosynthesis
LNSVENKNHRAELNIILIGNYLPDRQESMQRFAHMLNTGFQQSGYVSEIWRPIVFFGRLTKNTSSGFGKWLGYLDKWIIFPIHLRMQIKKQKFTHTRFHICDHSNAPYMKYLPSRRSGITCHDVLAIRGALGYADAHCPSSRTGKLFQKWIFNNLRQAERIAFVSRTTYNQFRELVDEHLMVAKINWKIIHNALNDEFSPASFLVSESILNKTGIIKHTPFLLHVGSDLPRKNRRLLVDMLHQLGKNWNGSICFAGQPADEVLLAHAKSLGLEERIVSVSGPVHDTLVALYSRCEAFIFPSFSEGFGWPLVEAQACGAPVIASNIDPMPEISGASALLADPANPVDFANAFLTLNNFEFRQEIIQKGIQNSSRFEKGRMIRSYLDIHGIKSDN